MRAVMADQAGPMRVGHVHAAVEAWLGETVLANSVSWVLASHSAGPSPLLSGWRGAGMWWRKCGPSPSRGGWLAVVDRAGSATETREGRAARVSAATEAGASLPACAHRSDLCPLDTPRARQGAEARLCSHGCRVGAAGAPSRAAAQRGQGAVAGRRWAAHDRVRASGWRRSAGCAHCDGLAATLAYDHENRRALRR